MKECKLRSGVNCKGVKAKMCKTNGCKTRAGHICFKKHVFNMVHAINVP
jgi:hypothetical protein